MMMTKQQEAQDRYLSYLLGPKHCVPWYHGQGAVITRRSLHDEKVIEAVVPESSRKEGK